MAELLKRLLLVWKAASLEERKTLLRAMLERVNVRGMDIAAIQPRSDFYALLSLVTCGPDGRWVQFTEQGLSVTCQATRVKLVEPSTPPARFDYLPPTQ